MNTPEDQVAPACGYLPRAPYVGGPLDGQRAPMIRTKTRNYHPGMRDVNGKRLVLALPSMPRYVLEPGWPPVYRYTEEAS